MAGPAAASLQALQRGFHAASQEPQEPAGQGLCTGEAQAPRPRMGIPPASGWALPLSPHRPPAAPPPRGISGNVWRCLWLSSLGRGCSWNLRRGQGAATQPSVPRLARMAPRVGHPVPSAASQPPPRYVSVFKTRACSSQHHFITRCLSCSTMCEGALPPPCIVRKDPRVPHTARRGA